MHAQKITCQFGFTLQLLTHWSSSDTSCFSKKFILIKHLNNFTDCIHINNWSHILWSHHHPIIITFSHKVKTYLIHYGEWVLSKSSYVQLIHVYEVKFDLSGYRPHPLYVMDRAIYCGISDVLLSITLMMLWPQVQWNIQKSCTP